MGVVFEDKEGRYPVEATLYEDRMFCAYFRGLGDVGLTLEWLREDKRAWAAGSIASQVKKLVENAYAVGRAEAKQEIRDALGVRG